MTNLTGIAEALAPESAKSCRGAQTESAQLCRTAKGQNFRCGAVAARVLEEFLSASRPTRCKFVERDRYGRFVGNCYRADGASVAELLVLSGWALDWPRYSKGEYADEQAQARVMRLGLWAGKFTFPWEWRAQRRGRRADRFSLAN